jgi:hypothetical protein
VSDEARLDLMGRVAPFPARPISSSRHGGTVSVQMPSTIVGVRGEANFGARRGRCLPPAPGRS